VAGFLSLLAFVVLLLFAIFFHEFGHFITARWAGIKVSKFFIGFGPTVWSTRRGRVETIVGPGGASVTRPETEYGIKAFPVGGFVKIVGMSVAEEVPPEDQPRAFGAAPRWKRAIVLAAGSATHFVTAFVFLFIILTAIGVPDRPTLVVGGVSPDLENGRPTPAAMVGFKPGDRIVAIDGQPARTWDVVASTIRSNIGHKLDITVERDGERIHLEPTPVRYKNPEGKIVGLVGVTPEFVNRRLGPVQAVGTSASAMKNLVGEFFHRVPSAFSPQTLGITGGRGPSDQRPFSIIGAGRIATDLASHGRIADFLFLFVQINIFVAIFNMLPLPPLDGGHLIVLLIEKIRGRPVDQRALLPVMAVVLSVLLLLALLLGYYDITSPIKVTP
jgi:membrane-associated protease RseP (regulator of RpoE activity)